MLGSWFAPPRSYLEQIDTVAGQFGLAARSVIFD
jgi:hypothetical protein